MSGGLLGRKARCCNNMLFVWVCVGMGGRGDSSRRLMGWTLARFSILADTLNSINLTCLYQLYKYYLQILFINNLRFVLDAWSR